MLKKIAIIVLCALPLGLFAQEVKLGHVNSQEVLSQLPEIEKLKTEIDNITKQWEDLIMKMREEYSAKITEFQDQQETMPESIKKMRISEIQDIEQRVSNTQQQAYNDLQEKQQELIAPILEKVRKAIGEVGAEGNFLYIFDTSRESIIYESPRAVNVTDLVKKKLGVK